MLRCMRRDTEMGLLDAGVTHIKIA